MQIDWKMEIQPDSAKPYRARLKFSVWLSCSENKSTQWFDITNKFPNGEIVRAAGQDAPGAPGGEMRQDESQALVGWNVTGMAPHPLLLL